MKKNRLYFVLKDSVKTSQGQRIGVITGLLCTFTLSIVFLVSIRTGENLDQIYFSTSPPKTISVCGDPETYEIEYLNTSGFTLTNQELEISFPLGVKYIAGSIQQLSGHTITEEDISDISRPVFSVEDLDEGETVKFSILQSAEQGAIDSVLGGSLTRNELTLVTNEGSAEASSPIYNIIFPFLKMVDIRPAVQYLTNGDTSSLSLKIFNSGYGSLESFYMTDKHEPGLEVLGVNIGTINNRSDTIFFGPADFRQIGNRDDYFDEGEFFPFTKDFLVSSCTGESVTSILNLEWGCNGSLRMDDSARVYTFIQLKLPNLSVNAEASLSSCFAAGDASPQQIVLNNQGEGTAVNVIVDIYKSKGAVYDADIFSRIDTGSFTLQKGVSGIPIPISPIEVESADTLGDFSCLGPSPIGKVSLALPVMESKEVLIIKWNTYNCPLNSCEEKVNSGWKFDLTYGDICGDLLIESSHVGEKPRKGEISVFSESPSDMGTGQKEVFIYTMTGVENSYSSGPGAHYEMNFRIPNGLLWEDLSEDLSFKNIEEWIPTEVAYDSVSRTLTARYPLPAPFIVHKSELAIWLKADCQKIIGDEQEVSLDLQINFVPDSTCESEVSIPFLCERSVDILLHCSQTCDEGLSFDQFDISRTSFGQADNDQNGLPDAGGSLNMRAVRDNRAMVGDTLQAVFRGISHTTATHPNWSYGYAKSKIGKGVNLKNLGAQVRIYDVSEAVYLTCPEVVLQEEISGEDKTFLFDFSPLSLGVNCTDFQGFKFGEGDSIWLITEYIVEGNIGSDVQEVKSDNTFYLSNLENPAESAQYSCTVWGDKFTLIGYFFANDQGQNITVDACSKTVSQDFKLSIGTCCSNYERGDLFPYEYRNWGHVTKAWTVIPENYDVRNIRLIQRRTKNTIDFVTEQVASIEADSVVGDTLWFDLEQYFIPFGGNLNLSDEGFRGSLEIDIAPTCEVALDVKQDMPWEFRFKEVDRLSGGETDWYTSEPDKIMWSPPSLSIFSPSYSVDGEAQTVSWQVEVKNNSRSASASNAWLHTSFPDSLLNFLAIVDEQNGDTLTMQGDIYPLGSIARQATRKFIVYATYNSCESAYFDLYAGLDCNTYPSTFSDFTCQYIQAKIEMEPELAAVNMVLLDSIESMDCADNEIKIEGELSSVHLVSVDSISATISFSGNKGLNFQAGSFELKYPNTSTFISVPTRLDEDSSIQISLLGYEGGQEPGDDPLGKNKLRLRFNLERNANYRPGDIVDITIFSREACRRPLPLVNLKYDPMFAFSRNPATGLMDDVGDSWSVAWGDYDQDGYEDVYITEYDYSKGSYLYRNTGEGTFTRITAGPQVNDIGATIGSSWGDYDNDGDLDLFVVNNARASNHLYENKGDGTFDRADAGDLSTYGGRCQNAAWVDYDNDGWLDVYVTDYLLTHTNQLFHNNQDGTFSQVKDNPITSEYKYSVGATWSDYDNDGLQDLFVPHGRTANNSLFHNDGGGEFTRIRSGSIVSDLGNSSGSAWGDYDNDGDMDLYVTNRSNQFNFFYINKGNGAFIKNSTSIISKIEGNSNGAAWADVNNDGWLDLFVGNDNGNLNHLYMNQGDGSFQKSESPINTDLENSMGAAFGDIDNDGDLELLVANTNGKPNTLYQNNGGNCNSWKAFKLEGTKSNRSGIGAKIRVKAKIGGQVIWQTREISGQTGGGTSSQNTMKAYFGLGDASIIDTVMIHWPSGFTQYLTHVETGNIEEVIEKDLFVRVDSAGLSEPGSDSWSAAWGDYDQDGYEDLYVTEFKHYEGSYLYHNEGDGTFSKLSSGHPVEEKGASGGSTWGDYDNDGDLDLFVSNKVYSSNPLYENQGNGEFLKVDAGDISRYGSSCHNAVWIDYDNDGWLDMFVSDFLPSKFNQLYHNNGNGTFTQVIDNLIVTEAQSSIGATWADYDQDGLIDLFVPNAKGENNSLYHNLGNGKFDKIVEGDIVNDGGNSVGSAWGDYDNDGDLDLYVSNTGLENNFLYVNNGEGNFGRETKSLITRSRGHSQGAAWADVNNDGYLDLFVSSDSASQNHLYMNQGNGVFLESESEVSLAMESSKGAAFADIDNDGDLELFVANDAGDKNAFYRNETGNHNNWKAFKLEGLTSNRSAIGARIRMKARIYGEEVWQMREISAQSGGGSSSQNTLRAYFGLGDATRIDSVVINWPSGYEQILAQLSVNDIQEVVEAAGAEICGLVYYDINKNCKQDEDEPGIPNVMLEILPGPKYVVTDEAGTYTINRPYGSYDISLVSHEDWVHTGNCDTTHSLVYESANRSASRSFCGKDFSMKPRSKKADLVPFLASTALRRGYRNTYAISYLNRGSLDAYQVELHVTFDKEVIPLSADIPWDRVIPGNLTNTYVWRMDTVASLSQTTIRVLDSVSADAELNKLIRVSASFKGSFEDENKANNSIIDYNPIIGTSMSYSKEVFPTGAVLPEDTLTYKIRFQNTSASYVQHVQIFDTLSPHLDESSIKVVGASHPYQLQLSEDRVLSFTFDRINLAGTKNKETARQGFIQFNILPKPDTELGTEIKNRASIHIDQNEGVLTNFAYNWVENTRLLAKENRLKVLISPNPMNEQAEVRVVSTDNQAVQVSIQSMEIFTSQGARVSYTDGLEVESFQIARKNLMGGMYFIQVKDTNGFIHTGKLLIE